MIAFFPISEYSESPVPLFSPPLSAYRDAILFHMAGFKKSLLYGYSELSILLIETSQRFEGKRVLFPFFKKACNRFLPELFFFAILSIFILNVTRERQSQYFPLKDPREEIRSKTGKEYPSHFWNGDFEFREGSLDRGFPKFGEMSLPSFFSRRN